MNSSDTKGIRMSAYIPDIHGLVKYPGIGMSPWTQPR